MTTPESTTAELNAHRRALIARNALTRIRAQLDHGAPPIDTVDELTVHAEAD